jgi:hypothetical protein
MSIIDYAARLELIQAAITALLTGGYQSYEIEGQRVTKLDLDSLVAEERRLGGLVKRQQRGSAFRRVDLA